MKEITVVIVDDHKLFREMLAKTLALNKQIKIAGESGTWTAARKLIKFKKPDIVLLDINFPKGSGFDIVPGIKKFSPRTRIIAVTMYNQPAYAQKMLDMGANGYVTKNSPYNEILKAIEKVMKDQVYLCTEIKNNLVQYAWGRQRIGLGIKKLSSREIEVVKLIKDGLTSKQTAKKLGLALKTVEAHRYHIFRKLKLKNIASLISYFNSAEHVLI